MKIAIFSPYATVVPHFETDLELAQRHLDQGHQVEFLDCRGGLANCDFNVNRDPARCRACVGRREMGLELLQPRIIERDLTDPDFRATRPVYVHPRSSIHCLEPNMIAQACQSLDALRRFSIDNFELGFAVLSSLVSHCRDPEPDLTTHRELLERFLHSAFLTYRQTQAYIDQHRPDRIYVFNGRFAAMRAVFRAAKSRGVECRLHERGCDGQHYNIVTNHLPHDIPAMEKRMREAWENAVENPEREALAAQWYHQRAQRVERVWHSFVKEQQPGTLPADWNSARVNISLFNSSDDEFVAIGDCWKNDLYPNQAAAVQKIAQSLLAHPQLHLTVRMHPNLRNVSHRYKADMLRLTSPNLTIVPPEGVIDTYALMRASDIVVTFGSTIGIEAVFWERPSVLLGPSFYRGLGGTYQPRTHEETIEMLTRPLKPQSRQGAFLYGFWQQTCGTPYQYFESTGLFEGQFKSLTLYARPPKKTWASRICNELTRVGARLLSRRGAD